jgi:opacity protein-like surface antigen
MKYLVITLALAFCLASLSSAAEVRMRYSNNNYNATTSFGGTWHPGTVFKPTSSQYPVFVKTGHFGFGTANVGVQVKVWSTTGNTPGSLLATFPVTTKAWPTWTDVDLTSAGIVIGSYNFFLSTNNPQMGPLGSSFRGSGIPGNYQGYHYYSSNDTSWTLWIITDWAIECTVDTNYVGIAPASLGRVKALYR